MLQESHTQFVDIATGSCFGPGHPCVRPSFAHVHASSACVSVRFFLFSLSVLFMCSQTLYINIGTCSVLHGQNVWCFCLFSLLMLQHVNACCPTMLLTPRTQTCTHSKIDGGRVHELRFLRLTCVTCVRLSCWHARHAHVLGSPRYLQKVVVSDSICLLLMLCSEAVLLLAACKISPRPHLGLSSHTHTHFADHSCLANGQPWAMAWRAQLPFKALLPAYMLQCR